MLASGLREGYFWGDAQVPGPPSESPYKEVLSPARVESGLSAAVSLLDGADSFASRQHLPSLSGSDPKAPPPVSTLSTSPPSAFPLTL